MERCENCDKVFPWLPEVVSNSGSQKLCASCVYNLAIEERKQAFLCEKCGVMVTDIDHTCLYFGRIVDEAIIEDRKVTLKKLNITRSHPRRTYSIDIKTGSRYLDEIKWNPSIREYL